MAWLLAPTQATDSGMMEGVIPGAGGNIFSTNAPKLFMDGKFYIQMGPSPALANSTSETSILNPTSGNISSFAAPNIDPVSGSTNTIPPYALNQGTYLRVIAIGLIGNTATPTLRIRTVLKNSAGTIVYTLSDTGAQATTTVTANGDFFYQCDFWAIKQGGSSNIGARSALQYATNVTALAFLGGTGNFAALTVDITQQYTIDVLATWGAASASNTLTTELATIELVG